MKKVKWGISYLLERMVSVASDCVCEREPAILRRLVYSVLYTSVYRGCREREREGGSQGPQTERG